MADEEEEQQAEEGAPAWMATFGDLMSILLTFFILLLSFAEMDETKFKDSLGSVQTVLGILPTGPGFFAHTMNPLEFTLEPIPISSFRGTDRKGEGEKGMAKESEDLQLKSQISEVVKNYIETSQMKDESLSDSDPGTSQASADVQAMMEEIEKAVEKYYAKQKQPAPSRLEQLKAELDKQKKLDTNEAIKDELERMINSKGLGEDVSVESTSMGIVMRVKGKIFFDLGKANLKKQSNEILDKVAEIIKGSKRRVGIEGHTDNLPIRSGKYASNWELSTARAFSTFAYLRDVSKINAKNISITGFADTKPVASNATSEGRSKNRRVEFIFYSR